MNIHALSVKLRPGALIFHQVWKWWSGELLRIVPEAWRDRVRPRIEAHITADGIQLEIIRPPSSCKKALLRNGENTIEPAAFVSSLRREGSTLPVWLFPPPEWVLSRVVQVPRSVVPSFAKLLSLEADRWTPYNLTDIAVAWRQVASHGETKADIELRFLPLACLERCSRQLAAFDLVPSLIVLGPTQELHAQVTTDSGPRTRLRSLRNISAAILALATIVFVVTDWIVCMREGDAWRHRLQFEQNEYARQRDLEKRIAVVLSASNEQSTGEGPRSRNALLASLTAVIPTTDWLSEIVIRNDAITLRGLSAKPELLVKALEPVASNHEVTLQGELAFDAKLDRQRMSVAFRMGDKRE